MLAAALTVTLTGAAAEDTPGAHDYAAHCAVCHGVAGHGDGPLGSSLRRPPRDLTLLARDNGGSFPETVVYQVVDGRRVVDYHGPRDMPVWGERFAAEGDDEAAVDERIGALVRHIEGLQQP